MSLALREAGARWVGGLGRLALLAVIFHGLWQGAGRPLDRAVPGLAAVARLLPRLPDHLLWRLRAALAAIPLSWPDSARTAALLIGSVSFWPGLGDGQRLSGAHHPAGARPRPDEGVVSGVAG